MLCPTRLASWSTRARSAVSAPGSSSPGPSGRARQRTRVVRRRNERRSVVDDDFRELEPHISDHPFQPGSWPEPVAMSMSTAGPVATQGGAHPHRQRGSDAPIRVGVGWTRVETGRRCWSRLARVRRRCASHAPRHPKVVAYGVLGCWRGSLARHGWRASTRTYGREALISDNRQSRRL